MLRGARIAMGCAAALAIVAASALTAAPAEAAPRKPQVVAAPPTTIRVDRQEPAPRVTVLGVARSAAITIDWGDGTVVRARTRCTPSVAAKRAAACQVSRANAYYEAGDFVVTVWSGNTVLSRHPITVRPEPAAWAPPEGWAQPSGWAVLNGGATYLPCSTVRWHWDRTGEPAGRELLRDDVPAVLGLLARETGLTFVETSDPGEAGLVFNWSSEVDSAYAGAAAIGGGSWNSERGTVTISPTNWAMTNAWRGFGIVTQPDGTYAAGNAWVLVHEVMHAMGFDHVDDPTQVMHPVSSTTALGSGDLDGLRTAYLSQPCPVD